MPLYSAGIKREMAVVCRRSRWERSEAGGTFVMSFPNR